MEPDTFDRQIEAVHRRLDALKARIAGSPAQTALAAEAFEELSATVEQLHVAGEELRRQTEELTLARQALEEERPRYQELFEFAPDAYLVTDEQGIIREANRAAAGLLGLPRDQLAGRPLASFVAEKDCKAFRMQLNRLQSVTPGVLLPAHLQNWSLALAPHSGKPVPAGATVGLVHDAAGRLKGIRWLLRDLTERRRAEYDARIASFAELDPGPIVEVNLSGAVKYANEAARRLFPDLEAADFSHPFLRGLDAAASAMQPDPTRPLTREIELGDLSYEQVLYYVPRTRRLRIYGRDVTERKRADRILRESEERFRAVADFTYNWEYWQAPDLSIVYMSPSVERITGYRTEEFQANPSLLTDIIHPDDRPRVLTHVRKVTETEEVMESDFRILRRDGQVRWIGHVCQPIYDRAGRILGRRASNRDITERKRAEQALRENQALLEAFLDNVPAVVYVKDLAGRYLLVNRAHEQLLSVGKQYSLGKTDDDLFPPETAEAFRANDRRVLEARRPLELEEAVVQQDGPHTYVSVKFPLFGPDGTPAALAGVSTDITERKRAEDQRRALYAELRAALDERDRALDEQLRARGLLETVMENTQTCLVYLDPRFQIVIANSAYVKTARRGRTELLGRGVFEAFPSRESESLFRQVRDTGEPLEFHATPYSFPDQPDRGMTYWDWTLTPVRDKEGVVEGLVLSLRDVTEMIHARQRIEALAAESQRRASELNAVLWQMPAGVLIAEALSGRIILANQQMDQILGRPLPQAAHIEEYGELQGFHPDGRPCEAHEWPLARSLRSGEEVRDEELNLRHDDGSLATVLVSSIPILNPQGKILACVATFYDITEREKAERAREEHLDRLKRLIHVSEDILTEKTLEGLLQRIADGARHLTAARSAVAGHGHHEGSFRAVAASLPESAPPVPSGEILMIQSGGVGLDLIDKAPTVRLTDEQLRRHPSWKEPPAGHPLLRGLLGVRLVGRDGQATGLILVGDREAGDFTVEDEALLVQLGTLASLALQQLEARADAERRADELDAVFAAMTEAVVVFDADDRAVKANPAAAAVYGFDPTRQPGLRLFETLQLRRPDRRPVSPEQLPTVRARAGATVVGERYLLQSQGREIIVQVSASPLKAGRRIRGVVVVWHDVTGQERTAEEIRQLNRQLEERVIELRAANQELESFSYSVSHDLRTPLSSIAGFAEVLLEDYGPTFDPEGRRYLTIIQTNIRKMGQLIDDLLAFSRLGRQPLHPADINMEELFRNVLDDLRALLPPRRLEVELKPLPPAKGDFTLIRQVVTNLLANALKFTKYRETARVEIGGSREQDACFYYVKDNGAGFDMQYISKLFQVFQRLHPPEEFEGTGVGLAIVHRIIARHGGRVWAEGKPGEGATFYFGLPA